MRRVILCLIFSLLSIVVHSQSVKVISAATGSLLPEQRSFETITDSLQKQEQSIYLLIELPVKTISSTTNSEDFPEGGEKYIAIQKEASVTVMKFKDNKITREETIQCAALAELLSGLDNYDVLTYYVYLKNNNTIAARFSYLGSRATDIRDTYKEVANENIVDTAAPADKVKAANMRNSLGCISELK